MDDSKIEDARKACLKGIFGSTLSEQEEVLLHDFLLTSEGTQYKERGEEMKSFLSDVVTVKPQVVDSKEMISRFEEAVRKNARIAQKKFPWAVAGTFGLTSLMAFMTYSLKGWSLITIAAIGCAVMMMGICVVMYFHNKRMLSEKNLYELLKSGQQKVKEPKNRIVNFFIAFLPIFLVGFFFYEYLGERGFVTFLVLFVLTMFFQIFLQKETYKKDQEVWDWWEGSLGD